MSLISEEKASILQQYRLSDKDTGSVEVQVALLTGRIEKLKKHFKEHNHDHHSRRGLIRMVKHRGKLLAYLKRKDQERYRNLVQRLKLRSSSIN